MKKLPTLLSGEVTPFSQTPRINILVHTGIALKAKGLARLGIFGFIFVFQNYCQVSAQQTVGEQIVVQYDSPHPYKGSKRAQVVWSEEIYTGKNSRYVAVHFNRLDLIDGDLLIIRSPDNRRRWEYSDEDEDRSEFWSIPIYGDRLILEIISSSAKGGYGYSIDKIARGFNKQELSALFRDSGSICGSDDTEEAICFKTTEALVYERSKAVARLLINGTEYCTGWLIGDEGHLMTCYHCIPDQTTANNTIVEMMVESEECGIDCENPEECDGVIVAESVSLVQVGNDNLDYSLSILPTNITSTYGYLQVIESGAWIGERVYLPQHPGGLGKRIALESDATSDTDGFPHVVAFLVSAGNTNHTIGIAAENIGDQNNKIRRNSFSGLTIANEAFGMNGATGLVKDGLRYTCNDNSGTEDKDFFIEDSEYETDNVSALQLGFGPNGEEIATGNAFASTGDQVDGDFANYGIEIDEYHYYNAVSTQTPNAVEGIANTVEAFQNACSESFCAPPCLSSNELADLKEEYFDLLGSYLDFIEEEEWAKATSSKTSMDNASRLIIQHYLIDTIAFNRDSLRAWYARLLSVSGDILLAKDFAAEGDFTEARQILEDISSRFDLTSEVEDDIATIDTVFGMLDARGFEGLTQADVDDLIEFSNNRGHSAAIARSILTLSGFRFGTTYVLPDQPEPLVLPPGTGAVLFEEVTVYPNPTNGDFINVIVPDRLQYETVFIEVWNTIGIKVTDFSLSQNHNVLELPSGFNAMMYRIIADGYELNHGRLLIIR